jgi:ribosomal protein L37E
MKDLGGMLNNKLVLDLAYRNGAGVKVATFSDAENNLKEWQKVISESMAGNHNGADAEEETETCPRCGRRFAADRLLKEGCPVCGWVSPRLMREWATV